MMVVQTPSQSQTLWLQLPQDLTLHVTPAQFASLAAANRELRLERTATGELIVTPPTGSETGNRNLQLGYFLVRWIEEEGGHGLAFDSSSGFELPNGANRSPDVSWVCQERWDALTPTQRQGFAPLCPDFVVELRSASDRSKDLRAKMQEYLENGARLGWLIDPKHKRVEIYRPSQAVETLENPITLSGEQVLPGFTLNLKRIWA